MKKTVITATFAALLLLPAGHLVSQSPEPAVPVPAAVPVATVSPAEIKTAQNARALELSNQQIKQAIKALQAMQASNQQLIEQQQKTLLQLDAAQNESDQIRILGRRN